MDNNTAQVLGVLLAFAGLLLFSITICYSVKQVVAGKPKVEPQQRKETPLLPAWVEGLDERLEAL